MPREEAGKISVDELRKQGMSEEMIRGAIAETEAQLSLMSPPGQMPAAKEIAVPEVDPTIKAALAKPGALGLPPLLEKRRLEFGIVDGAFRGAPLFDRIFVWMVPLNVGSTYAGSEYIYMPETAKSRELIQSPRGILVGAGLKARDILSSHGVELGHMVWLVRMAPWSIEIDNVGGKRFWVTVAQAGDLVWDEDLGNQMLRGETSVGLVNGQHVLFKDGLPVSANPIEPWRSDAP